MHRSLLIIILSFFLLSSCGTTVEKISRDIDRNLAEDSGYLLIGIETNQDLRSIHIYGQESLTLGHKDVNKEASYILVDVEAGSYTFEKIRLSRYWRIDLDDDDVSWSFDIKPNQISYVGDLEVTKRGHWLFGPANIELANRSSEALEFMEGKFPNILNNRKMVYTGPGNDEFFEFVSNIAMETAK